MQKNSLKGDRRFKLGRWLENNEEAAKTAGYKELAEQAAAELGFPVTVPNVTSVINAIGIDRPTKKKKAKAPEIDTAGALIYATSELAKALIYIVDTTGLSLPNEREIRMLASSNEGQQDELLLTTEA